MAGLKLDVHLRRGDEVHVYCGRTRVLTAKRAAHGSVTVWAHETYRKQPCAKPLFRSWKSDARAAFEAALDAYVREVQVGKQWTKGEGAVQARWSRIRAPWIPFDREAVLGYDSGGRPVFERVERRACSGRSHRGVPRVGEGAQARRRGRPTGDRCRGSTGRDRTEGYVVGVREGVLRTAPTPAATSGNGMRLQGRAGRCAGADRRAGGVGPDAKLDPPG